jgi:selenocysteine lyase/cysteine desulfurase
VASRPIAPITTHEGLANQLRAGLSQPPSNSAITVVDEPDAAHKLAGGGVAASTRQSKARLAFHLYNTEADVALALRALRS